MPEWPVVFVDEHAEANHMALHIIDEFPTIEEVHPSISYLKARARVEKLNLPRERAADEYWPVQGRYLPDTRKENWSHWEWIQKRRAREHRTPWHS